MSRRNPRESDIVETAATVAVGAAAVYGCYKLCQSIFDSKLELQQINVRRDSSPSLGAQVSNAIDGMQLAYSGLKLCETVMDALPRDEPQRVQTARPLQSIHSSSYPHPYPHPIQSDYATSVLSTRNESSSRSVSAPKLTGEDVLNTMMAVHAGYKLCQSFFGSDSSNATSSNRRPMVRVAVVETEAQCQEALAKLNEHCKEYKVLGFECEWVHQGCTRLPVSLVQLATQDGYCALFRLNKLKRIPPMLKKILSDPNIIKVSSVPDQDAQYLHADYGVFVKSVLDLRFMAREAGHRNPGGLTVMSKKFLGISLDENWYLRASNWNASYLAGDQIEFAYDKTRADIELFKFFAEEIAPERRFNGEAQHLQYIIKNHCSKYLNRKYE